MIVSVIHIKFWILRFQREHSLNLPTSTELCNYINDSNDVDVKRVYSRIEISKLLSTAVGRGILYKVKEDKKLMWGVRMEVKPVDDKVVKKIKVWDGKLEPWKVEGEEEEEEEIWEPDKPSKSKKYWDGSKENIWEVK